MGGSGLSRQRFCELFSVPDIPAALETIGIVVTPQEQDAVLALGSGSFTAEDAGSVGGPDFVVNAYQRGVCSLEGPRYRIADYYTRLEIFAVAEFEAYRGLKVEYQRDLGAWYFDAYYKRLSIRGNAPPTLDAVLSLQETLDFIENEKRQAYLVRCDCRSLAAGAAPEGGICEKPLEVCISFRHGPNSPAHRGISRAVSKAEAKQAVMDADRAGLMHTANETSICNCCTDCCYLSRARRRRHRELGGDRITAWPLQTKSAVLNASNCLSCAACVSRCPFGLFSLKEGKLSLRTEYCAGCGLCVNTCPGGALELRVCRS
ncbi:MAG: 4Fe-4S binding protein [Spirochaetaceae bacterium]|jgi:Pyruvate/2-oxoacid:ferredoxin oxidoreductase delta subunit|nr:4Fe-4S binding protein [Spirochaetaceae bacterium]